MRWISRIIPYLRRRGKALFRRPPSKPEQQRSSAAQYSVKITNGHRYYDGIFVDWPHFVLCDANGKSRVSLSHYPIKDNVLEIRDIQREHSVFNGKEWDREGENRAQAEWRKGLRIHPTELLFRQFLHHFSKQIQKGMRVHLRHLQHQVTYQVILNRYFKLIRTERIGTGETSFTVGVYELDLNKALTRKAIGFPPKTSG